MMDISPFKKSFGPVPALDFPGMSLESGTVCALVGANGSGKTTFARVLSGIIKPDGHPPVKRGLKVGYLPQKGCGFRMSAKRSLRLAGVSKREAAQILNSIGIDEKARCDRLSVGQNARLSLWRILRKRFDLLILDEPTASMDAEYTLLAQEAIARYAKEQNAAVILITHSLAEAQRLADKILFFRQGRTEAFLPTEEFLSSEEESVKQFIDMYRIR